MKGGYKKPAPSKGKPMEGTNEDSFQKSKGTPKKSAASKMKKYGK